MAKSRKKKPSDHEKTRKLSTRWVEDAGPQEESRKEITSRGDKEKSLRQWNHRPQQEPQPHRQGGGLGKVDAREQKKEKTR